LNPEPLSEVRVRVEPPEALQALGEVWLSDVDKDSAGENLKLYAFTEASGVDSLGLAEFKALPFGTYHVSISNSSDDDTGVPVQTSCHLTDEKFMLKVNKPTVEFTLHIECKKK
jgi:hypothetical protein